MTSSHPSQASGNLVSRRFGPAALMARLGYRPQHLLYLPVTALCSVLAALIAHWCFGLDYSVGGVAATAVVLGPAFVMLAPAFRSLAAGTVLVLAATHLVTLAHAIKLVTLKAPVYASDFATLPLLVNVLSGRYLIAGAVGAAALLLLLAACLRLRARSLVPLTLTAAYGLTVVLTSPSWIVPAVSLLGAPPGTVRMGGLLDTDRRDEQLQRLQRQGAVLYLLSDWRAMRKEIGFVPSRGDVAAVGLGDWQPPAHPAGRNVHVVLLESIWDTSVLDGVSISGPQLDPRFVALWTQAGRPHALSPVLGAGTANAELEVLCGLPAPGNSIAFLGLLRPTPCLPALFRSMGYLTMASHPNVSSSWARNHAYGLLGFRQFLAQEAFVLDDMDVAFLSDQSLFRQNLERLRARKRTPVFNYVVSLSSHWGYARNKERRPDIVTVTPSNLKVLSAYANSSAYTTRAFMDWVGQVLAEDPDALIVAFGDHSPVLDADPDPYRNIAKPAGRYASPEAMRMVEMARVPLLVIDGRRGPVALPDDLPLYRLPQVIGAQLGLPAHLLPQSRPDSDTIVRPIRGGRLLAQVGGLWLDCGLEDAPARSAACLLAQKENQGNRVLRQDLLYGDAFALAGKGAALTHDLPDMDIVRDFKSCEFEIKGWGPEDFAMATPNGKHTMWISFDALRGRPEVLAAGKPIGTVVGDQLVSATLPEDLLPGPGEDLPVALRCPDGAPVQLGAIHFH